MFLSNQRSMKQNVTVLRAQHIGITCISLCLRFGIYVVIARVLGTQNFGVLLLMQGIAALLLPVLGIGMTPLASRTIAEIQHSETSRGIAGIFQLLWRQQCRRIVLYSLAYIPLTVLITLVTHGTLPLFLLLIAGLATLPSLLVSIVSAVLQGLRRYDLLARLRFFNTLLYLCLALVSTQIHGMLLGILLLAPAFASIITLTLALICIAKLLPLQTAIEPGPLLRERMEHSQHPSWMLFLLDSVIWRELLLQLVLLSYWHTPSMLSFYALSVLLCTRLMKVAPTLFVTCLAPLQSRLFPVKLYSTYIAFVRTSYAVAGIALVQCLLLVLCCPLLISLSFGYAYMPIVTPLRILLLSIVFGSVATIGLTYFTQHANTRERLWLGLGSTTLHIALGIPCILAWGIVGAAIASTIAHGVASIGTFLFCRDILLRGRNHS